MTTVVGLTCHNVGDQVSIQVWCDHDIKLVGPADQLHAGVVHNHLSVLDVGVLGCYSLAGLAVQGQYRQYSAGRRQYSS
jgi:hypothetical protein